MGDSNIPIVGSITKTAQAVKCPSAVEETPTVEGETMPHVNGLEGIGCKVCTFILNKLEAMIPVDAGEQKIEAALDKVCAKLPGFLDQPCETFVNSETPA